MRKVACACLVALAASLGAAASQAGPQPPGDGTLVVQNGRGIVAVSARGGIIGRFDSGRVIIDDPVEDDGTPPVVYGAERIRDLSDTKTLYIGTDLRFRIVGGTFRVRVIATGIYVSVVGRGTAMLSSDGFLDAGTFSLNGAEPLPVPDSPEKFVIGAPTAP